MPLCSDAEVLWSHTTTSGVTDAILETLSTLIIETVERPREAVEAGDLDPAKVESPTPICYPDLFCRFLYYIMHMLEHSSSVKLPRNFLVHVFQYNIL
jgi:hypothetical protein